MHLRTPILSAAVAMGIGGITTVHQVALASLRLSDEVGCPSYISFVSCFYFLTRIVPTPYECMSYTQFSFVTIPRRKKNEFVCSRPGRLFLVHPLLRVVTGQVSTRGT